MYLQKHKNYFEINFKNNLPGLRSPPRCCRRRRRRARASPAPPRRTTPAFYPTSS